MKPKLQATINAAIHNAQEKQVRNNHTQRGEKQSIQPHIAATATRTRIAIEAEETAIEEALREVLGPDRTAQLLERAESMPIAKARNADEETRMERALKLMETRKGRAKLATLTWDTV